MSSINKRVFALLSVCVILITSGVSYVNWNYSIFSPITYISYLLIGLSFIFTIKKYEIRKYKFGNVVVMLATLPLLSLIPLCIFGSEALTHSVRYFLEPMVLLVYFLLLKKHINSDTIISLFLFWGTIIGCVFILQQIFPENAVFGVFNEKQMIESGLTDNVSQRNDLFRYRLDAFFYVSYFCCFYSWDKLQNKLTISNLVIFVFFLMSIYMYLARQILFIVLLVIITSIFVKKFKLKILLPILLFGYIVYMYSDILFDSLLESAQDDISSDYIRFLSYSFFWDKSTDNPIVFLIGNGHMPDLELNWGNNYGFFASDIGIVGALYYYGVLWIIAYSFMFWKIALYYKQIPQYLLMFFFALFINSILIVPSERPSHMLFLSLSLFLLENQIFLKNENQIQSF
ncbi:hypothetical protein [uncultured Bacteroides sp.]|uniref:hypothetical protein n=1 Tax=uncultured Bacteroides sp. TaxID=162156 RepID=UPI0026298F3A|nr:hypothetical protein [uncultured Bacteroides sp.]